MFVTRTLPGSFSSFSLPRLGLSTLRPLTRKVDQEAHGSRHVCLGQSWCGPDHLGGKMMSKNESFLVRKVSELKCSPGDALGISSLKKLEN